MFLFAAMSGDAATHTFRQSSDPPGIVSQIAYLESGALASTIPAPQTWNQYRFTHWTIETVRQDDALGRALNQASFTIYEDSEAIAHYINATDDVDGDGLPDWFEIHYLSNTNSVSASDSDGDGYDLGEEYSREYHPGLADSAGNGGISRRRTPVVTMIALEDHLYTENSEPPGIVNISRVVSHGAEVLSTFRYGASGERTFAFWTVDGVRQEDAEGRALLQVLTVVTSDVVVTAHFFDTGEDTDEDDIAD